MSETNQNSNTNQTSSSQPAQAVTVQETENKEVQPPKTDQNTVQAPNTGTDSMASAQSMAEAKSAADKTETPVQPARVEIEQEMVMIEAEPAAQADENQEPVHAQDSAPAFDADLDHFAKALLEQKTEMAIYGDGMRETREPEAPVSLEQVMKENKEAEDTLADALDELRRERGQVPIDQEEEDFAWSQTVVFEDRFSGALDEDFTTESLFSKNTPSSAKTTIISGYNADEQRNYIEETEKRPVYSKKIKSRAAKNKEKTAAAKTEFAAPKEPVSSEPPAAVPPVSITPPAAPSGLQSSAVSQPAPAQTSTAQNAPASSVIQSVYVDEQHDKERHAKLLKWAVAVIIAGALCLGLGYWYKTEVYDVSHSATTEQQQTYDKLKTYADDYDTLSTAQKKDMAALLSSYSSMTDAQKEEINSYFKEKTGKTYVELTAQITDSSSASNSGSSTSQTDTAADQDSSASDDTSNASNDASSAADSSTQDQAGTSSGASVQTQTQTQTPSNSTTPSSGTSSGTSQTVNNAAVIAQYEQEIAQLQTDRANYIDFLASEGLPTSDEITAGYDAQIAYYQNLLNALR